MKSFVRGAVVAFFVCVMAVSATVAQSPKAQVRQRIYFAVNVQEADNTRGPRVGIQLFSSISEKGDVGTAFHPTEEVRQYVMFLSTRNHAISGPNFIENGLMTFEVDEPSNVDDAVNSVLFQIERMLGGERRVEMMETPPNTRVN